MTSQQNILDYQTHSRFNPHALFADRIGGSQFGTINKVFKFTLIDNAKKQFIAQNPMVKVIDLGVGEPEERAPDQVAGRLYREALLRENRIYPNNGTLPFKEAASRYLKRLLGLDFDPDKEIVHCIGSKTALAQAPFAFINRGDCVIATAPGYPVLPTITQWLDGRVHLLKLHARNRYLPDIAELRSVVEKEKPKMVLLNYPNNPTGAVASAAFYEEVVRLAHQHNFIIVQDAAYADMVFDGSFVSPFQVDGGREVTLELYSLSKSYNMQGYRIGFVASSALLLKAFALVKDNIDNGQFIAIQKAGVEALDNAEAALEKNRNKYRRRLERVCHILEEAGIAAKPSPGTFYLFFPVPEKFHGRTFPTAQAFTDYLISTFGIISVPWEETGPHIRLSMTFEVGTDDFADEEAVYQALRERLVNQRS